MKGKSILITGGNRGIGRATVRTLSDMGATVIMACRNADKTQSVIQQLKQHNPKARLYHLPLDLNDFSSIRAAADTFIDQFPKLDVLINNAGLYTEERELTANGYEMQFGVNHLGHFLLTHLLMPAMHNAMGRARIITTSSIAHHKGRIDFDNLKGEKERYDGLKAYAQSKLANVLFTRELARRFPEFDANVLHPGIVKTDIGSDASSWKVKLIRFLYRPFMISPEAGARTAVFLASAPEVCGVSGKFFDQFQNIRTPSCVAQSDLLAKQLWTYSCDATGVCAR